MKSIKFFAAASLFALGAATLLTAPAQAEDGAGAVFVMTNAASNNQIAAYTRNQDGSLQAAASYSTGGNGSGGTIDPLHSQGSLRLSADHRLLFAVNAGSGTVSSFAVDGSELTLADTQPSGGSAPSALAQSGDLLYVLNSGGSGNVSGFHVSAHGHLRPIANSTRDLSDTAAGATSLAFSPNRQFLVVTERATNNIDVFRVLDDGSLSTIQVNPSADAVPFAAVFAPNGALIVGAASNFVSSYQLHHDRTLSPITASLPTLGKATCWDVVTPSGRFVFTANAGTANLSGFAIARDGSLAPLGATIVGANPAGSVNLDTAISADGKFLYTLNTGTGSIGAFSVDHDGFLTALTTTGGLPVAFGLNGIAAY